MKKSTVENKLNELFGLTEKAATVKVQATGRVVGVTEREIQNFREAQGLIYYLHAPALFTPKTCPHCGEKFMVSRKYVAYCSYTCIRMSLREQGIEWKKDKDIEGLVNSDVYDGNEPIWIRQSNLTALKEALSTLLTHLENEDSPFELSPPEKLAPESLFSQDSTTSTEMRNSSRSSSARTTTSSTALPSDLFPTPKQQSATQSQSSRKSRGTKRKFT